MTILEEGGEFMVMGGDPRSLQEYLARTFSLSNSQAKQLVDDKRVFINEKRVALAKFSLKNGDLIEILKPPITWQAMQAVVYQDDHCLVVNKPANVNAVGSESVERWLKAKYGADGIAAVHRIDKDTTGCLLFARHADAQYELERFFREHQVKKTYLAIVHGQCLFKNRLIDTELDGKDARSIVSTLHATKRASLIQVDIETGRTHQIRRHLAEVGYPLAGDAEYGQKKVEDDILRKIPRQLLHAWRIAFRPSWKTAGVSVESPVPPDFLSLMKQLAIRFDG